jgi:MFS transporter, putative metabolite transport protein
MQSGVAATIYRDMDEARLRRLHWRIGFFAGLGAWLDGFDYAIIGIALIGIIPSLHPTPGQTAALVGAAYAGGACGGLIFGHLADRFGRKLLFIVDLAFFLVFAALSGFAPNVVWLIVLRFCLGIGLGGDFPLSASYMSEFAPRDSRGRLGSWVGSFWWVGALCAMLVAVLFLSFIPPILSWRWILASGSVPALIALWLRGGLPESPRWLIVKGYPNKAYAILKEFNPRLDAKQFSDMASTILEEGSRQRSVSPLELFRPNIVRSTIFTSGFFTCYTLAFYAVTIYGPVILRNLGGFTSPTAIASGAAFYFLWASIGAYANVLLVDRVGRKKILLIAFAGMAALLLLLARLYPPSFVLGLGLLSAFQFFQAFGPGALWASYIPEVFPTRLRASGHGMATFFSRLGAVASSFIWVWAVANFAMPGAFVVHAVFAVLGIILTLALGIETKQRSLEAINCDAASTNRLEEGRNLRELKAEI